MTASTGTTWQFGMAEMAESDVPELYALAQRLGPAWWRMNAPGLLPWAMFPRALGFRAQGSWVVRPAGDGAIGLVTIYDLDPRAGLAWLDIAATPNAEIESGVVAAWAIDRIVAVGDAQAVYVAYPEFAPPPSHLLVTPVGVIDDFVEHQGRRWALRYATVSGPGDDAGS